MKDLVIKNGTIVTPKETLRADILIRGEKIEALLTPGTPVAGAEVFDAEGKTLIPRLRRRAHAYDGSWHDGKRGISPGHEGRGDGRRNDGYRSPQNGSRRLQRRPPARED